MKKIEDTKLLTIQAFWAVLAKGTPPTIDLINQWMTDNDKGTRRRNDISEVLKTCWADLAKRTHLQRSIPGIPDDTLQLVIQLRENMHQLARAEFDKEATEVKENADNRVAQAEALATQADIKTTKALEALQRAGQEIVTAQEQQNATEQRLAHTEGTLRAEIANHMATKIRLAEVETIATGLKAELQAARTDHAAMLTAESDRYTQMQRTLLQQVDDGKTAQARLARQLEKNEQRLIEKENDTSARERAFNEQRAQLSAELGLEKGMVAALNKQISDLQASLANKEAEAIALRSAHQQQGMVLEQRSAELASMAGVSVDGLREIVTESFVAGENVVMSMLDKKLAKTLIASLDQKRRDEYALNVCQAIGASLRR